MVEEDIIIAISKSFIVQKVIVYNLDAIVAMVIVSAIYNHRC